MAAAGKTFKEDDSRPIKLFFQDEARFGRMQDPMRCWAPRRTRPNVFLQRVREYTYVFGAVCPKDGESFSLILPYSNTDMMNIFLDKFSEYYKDYRVVMVMDGASWHKSLTLKKYDNIRIIIQPPYSPELNPEEHIWDYVRENYLGNLYFKTIGKMEDKLFDAFKDISNKKGIIQSLVGFQWAMFNV